MKKYIVTLRSKSGKQQSFTVRSTGTFGAVKAGISSYPNFELLSVRPDLKAYA